MGQELPDNLVYASINPGAARSSGSQGELKVAGLTQRIFLNKDTESRPSKKEPDLELLLMTSAYHFVLSATFTTSMCCFLT